MTDSFLVHALGLAQDAARVENRPELARLLAAILVLLDRPWFISRVLWVAERATACARAEQCDERTEPALTTEAVQ